MNSKGRIQFNNDDDNDDDDDDEVVTDAYDKLVDKAAVGTGHLDTSNKPWYLILTLPIRIAEFVTTLLLFATVIYLIPVTESGLRNTTTIFMIVLSVSYLFFACIQIIAHFTGTNLPEYPFVFASFLGMGFYLAAGSSILYTAPTRSWGRLATFLLCFIIAAFHTATTLIVLAFWRERFRDLQKGTTKGNKIHPLTQVLYSRRSGVGVNDTCRCEEATSVSNCGFLTWVPDESVIEAHGCRKISTGHRRTYVDKKCSCPKVFTPKVTGVQTECGINAPEETQTCLEMKEIIIQTASKCELCNQQIIDPVPPEEVPLPVPTPPRCVNRGIQSGCIMPCPNSPSPPFLILPGTIPTLGNIPGLNPCCVACNCGHTPDPPTPAPPPPPPPPPEPKKPKPQTPWTATYETLVVNSGPCEKGSQHDQGTITMEKLKKAKPSISKIIDCQNPASILIHKNKRTQTKNKNYDASEESSDDKDDKKSCRCRRTLYVKSELKDLNKIEEIIENSEDLDPPVSERKSIDNIVNKKSSKLRTKPLYRESPETHEQKLRDSDNQTQRQNEQSGELPRRFKTKVSPSPSQIRPSQTILKKGDESTWQQSTKDDDNDDNLQEGTVRIEDVTEKNAQYPRQSPLEYLPPSQSTITREYQVEEADEEEAKLNEFPEEF